MADWDETESEEDREARLQRWLDQGRGMWHIFQGRPFFAGVWRIQDDYDEVFDHMTMRGRPDWPEHVPEWVEVHRLTKGSRPDKYQPEKHREYAFKSVMVIRAVSNKPIERRQEGKMTILSLDQEPLLHHLRLSGRFEPDLDESK